MAGAAHPPRRQKTNRPKSSWLGAAEPDLGREWGREDSNLRRLSRRVYSPFPLAARAHPREERIVAEAPCASVVVGDGVRVPARGLGPGLAVRAVRRRIVRRRLLLGGVRLAPEAAFLAQLLRLLAAFDRVLDQPLLVV